MATETITRHRITNGDNTTTVVVPTNDSLILPYNFSIIATGASSLAIGVSSNSTLTIEGAVVSGQYRGIYATGGNNDVIIGARGSIYGTQTAMWFDGQVDVVNAGSITSSGAGIVAKAGATVNNSGEIRVGTSAVVSDTTLDLANSGIIEAADPFIAVSSVGNLNLVNTGYIRGGAAISTSGGTNTLNNSGTIIGITTGHAYQGFGGVDGVLNNGLMQSETAGSDTVLLGAGADTYNGRGGTVIGWVKGEAGTDILLGGANVDWLDGGTEGDALSGSGGNDVLIGGAGADLMVGGAGNDTFSVENAGDAIQEAANEGTDQVFSSVSYTLAVNIEVLSLIGPSNVAINGGGNNGDNTLQGSAGNNILDARGGNDVLRGMDGNDTLIGGTGNDAMYGGAGDDYYFVDGGDSVTELANEGFSDTIQADFSYYLPPNVERLILTGGGNISANGNVLANIIIGTTGNNVIRGGGGPDTLTGNGGNDTFVFVKGETGDVITDFVGNGAAAGDSIVLMGYGAGATIVANGGGLYTIQSTLGNDNFFLTGDPALHASDYSFV